MMNFIRDNIVKIVIALVAIIIIIVIVVACSPKNTAIITKNDKTYSDMENRLQSAAIKLVESNKKLLPKTTDQVRKIQLVTLINNGLIKELHAIEDNNTVCKGYVEITRKSNEKENFRYTPYIKCGKYYETKSIADYIIENEEIVTNDEGLYKVPIKTEDQSEKYSYYFKGEYPNNYIVLDGKLYRIMEITEDNNLKLISTVRTNNSYAWDNRFNSEDNRYSGINDFSKSRMKDSLDFLYYNTDLSNGEVFFSDTEADYIIQHDFCVGKRSEDDLAINSPADCSEKAELHTGLITINDFYRISTDPNCDSTSKHECNNYNYMYNLTNGGIAVTTLVANKDNSYSYYIIEGGELNIAKCYKGRRLYPVIYIDKNIIYSSGDGTYDNPYIVR